MDEAELMAGPISFKTSGVMIRSLNALCGWKLPGKHFSRLIFGEKRPGQQEPDQVCRDCVDVMVEYDLKPERDDPTAVGTKEFADAVIGELEAVHA